MRDLLPPDAAAQAWLASRVTAIFESWGYDLVTTPTFEHAEVIERGLETVDRRDLLRFVEPDTGEVALLRPDITPQIARIIATRLTDRPAPYRLCYADSLIRQRRGRARKQRQIAQAGVEHVGTAGPEADAEVIELAVQTLRALGLEHFQLELHYVSVVRGLLAELTQERRELAERALSRKDAHELASILGGADRKTRERLLGAIELYGDRNILKHATRLFGKAALRELAAVMRRLDERGLGGAFALDLGEVRDAAYYTGVSFTILAHGPGEPLGSGGRYDQLLARFGAPLPATGFGLDLSNVEWALHAAGRPVAPPRPARIVVAGHGRERDALAARLREAGAIAALVPIRSTRAALDYARAWGYDAALMCQRDKNELVRTSDGAVRRAPYPAALNGERRLDGDFEALARFSRGER
jgi:ATP phosphoribosyltransferase regulatory subunit